MLLNYPLKPFWNSNFRPCRETKISKISIWTPLAGLTAPPTPQPPQLFSPSLHSVALYLALLGLPTPCFAQATTVRLWSGWSLCSLSYKFLLGKIILPLSCLSAECSLVAGFGCPQVGLYLSGSYGYICLFVNLS